MVIHINIAELFLCSDCGGRVASSREKCVHPCTGLSTVRDMRQWTNYKYCSSGAWPYKLDYSDLDHYVHTSLSYTHVYAFIVCVYCCARDHTRD
jgi:hypothetical protein